MAKMRGIKPETFTDDKILQISPLARWLFIGMWTQACDNGHVEDNPVQLKVRLLPMDNCDVKELVDELVNIGLVKRIEGHLSIPNLPHHQKIDRRFLVFCEACEFDPDVKFYPKDKLARSPSKRRASKAEDEGKDTRSSGARRALVDEGEGEGEGERGAQSKPSRKTRIPDDWEPTDSHKKRGAEKNLNLAEEAEKFKNWAIANDRKYVDWNRAFSNWLINARPQPSRSSGDDSWHKLMNWNKQNSA